MTVQLDVFPCSVVTPDGTHDRVRTIVADGRVHLFASDEKGHHEVAATDVVTLDQGGHWPYRLVTAAGEWVVRRGAGCGCGHPLRRAKVDDLLALGTP